VQWYLDFDGVLCDSLPEVWASSSRVLTPDAFLPWETVDENVKKDFLRYRPFVRAGADYVAIHLLLKQKSDSLISTQENWDSYLKRLGSKIQDFHRDLYKVRENWVREDFSGWVSLNHPYPGIPTILELLVHDASTWILSTKKPEFIRSILVHWGFQWPEQRILYAQEKKSDLLDKQGIEYMLLDDQIDHLNFNSSVGTSVLADWGYTTAVARKEAKTIWTLDDFLRKARERTRSLLRLRPQEFT